MFVNNELDISFKKTKGDNKMRRFPRILACVLCLAMCFTLLAGCGAKKETIVIYSCANDRRIAHMTERLQEKFPNYDFIVEYQGTSKLAAKLLAEGTNTDADIIHDLSYLNMDSLNNEGILADVSFIDTSNFVDGAIVSDNYILECRTGGSVIVNLDVLEARGLEKPQSYQDLLKPEYKGLISMPDPKSSGTGYMFVKSLVNAWGEESAIAYFEKLAENILQFTSSGNGPVNALVQQEVAIALGMTNNAVLQLDDGTANLEILFFAEGGPFTMYGQTIVNGKETRPAVKEVFEFMVYELMILDAEKFGAEKFLKNRDFTSENYPDYVTYADMSNDTLDEKARILEMWNIT